MNHRSKALVVLAALSMPVLVFGLPLLAAYCLGPERGEALGRVFGPPPPSPSPPLQPEAASRQAAHAHPAGAKVPAFSLTDQAGRPFTEAALRGRVWVASFFITRCAGPCPMTSSKMAALQRSIGREDVLLVSFSMNPDYDTPAVLAEYARRFGADGRRWHLLTGERRQIEAVVGALGLAERQGQRPGEMVHSDQFVLIDREGRSRGYYASGDPGAVAHLAADAAALAGDVATPTSSR